MSYIVTTASTQMTKMSFAIFSSTTTSTYAFPNTAEILWTPDINGHDSRAHLRCR